MIIERRDLLELRNEFKKENRKVVFTNGCFDLIHAGHVDYLNKAKEFGDILIVALNSDESIRRIKGSSRPIVDYSERSFVVSNLKCVDYVTYFEEDTPKEIIDELIPDILVKGADWDISKIVGRETVEAHGGEVKTIEFVNQQSTSNIIKIILERYKE